MIQILNLEEARNWAEENVYEADSFLYPLNVAVKNGLLIKVDDTHFAIVESVNFGCTWHLDYIHKLTDEEMKEHNLYCRYQYCGHTIKTPESYIGVKEIRGGFNFGSE